MNFTTPVEMNPVHPGITYQNKILMLGSCFADEVGHILKEYRFQTEINPFGTLYNPCSIANSVERLSGGQPFTPEEVILSGGIYTSFSHHSSVSGSSAEAFLEMANSRLAENAASFRQTDTFIITLGTAYIYRHRASGEVVSNCHKIKASEFNRSLLSVAECTAELLRITEGIEKSIPEAGRSSTRSPRIIFTVSPIRHLKETAHGNQVSKSTLLLAVEELLKNRREHKTFGSNHFPVSLHYFPSYEIMMDELRDYRFYAADMVHPSPLAVEYIFERFKECFISTESYPLMREAMRLTKAENHRPLFPDTPEYARFLEKLEEDKATFFKKVAAGF